MGLLDALDESIATVEAEHQDKGSPTTATLASTAAAPPASCGTYERTASPDTYRCAANGFYLYKRSENSWCVGKEPGGASCKCYESKKGWQFYVSKKWTLRADVSLTWSGAATDQSAPAAEEITTLRIFDLDHLGAKVGQHHAAKRASNHISKFDDPHPPEHRHLGLHPRG